MKELKNFAEIFIFELKGTILQQLWEGGRGGGMEEIEGEREG